MKFNFVKLVFLKCHNIYEFGIIGKLIKSSVWKCKNLNFGKSRQDVPFVVLGHTLCASIKWNKSLKSWIKNINLLQIAG